MTTDDRWRRVSRIYHDALAESPSARDELIRRACQGDEELERDVRSLLAQASGDSFLDGLMPTAISDAPRRLAVPGQLGRFELRALLGAGGMGEVYQAHDPSLGRDVALKIMPAAFTTDADRLARFEREAKVLAALSHPHIGTIYGIESIAPTEGGAESTIRALVLELVDGVTLAERLRRGPMPVDEAVAIARQIASALEAAHDKGVIHRDLKPANIKVRSDGVVKVLDFGLAKADGLNSETSVGVILGTPGYMSPEQARGLPVDKRADVWAFGCVLYEMLCGRAPFPGATPSDVLATVLQQEPDWQALPASTPPSIRRLLVRCLEKDLPRRLRDLGDGRLELDDADAPAPAVDHVARARRRTPWLVAAGAAAVAAAALVWPRSSPSPPPIQFALTAGDGVAITEVPVPSPDGRRLVFQGRSLAGESALWVRTLDSPSTRRLAGTENAQRPFWSPDGAFVGFAADGTLKRASVAGGPVQRIVGLDPTTLGATWNRDNVVVFSPSNKAPLHRVSGAGGRDEPLTVLDAERRENSHRWPHFLPDGRHFLFTARSDLPEQTAIYVASLDDPRSPKRLLSVQSRALYVSSGHLLFVRDNVLLQQPFNPSRLELSGDPVAIAGDVVTDRGGAYAAIAASADGAVITYNTLTPARLVWRDRSGRDLGTIAVRGDFSQIRLSPDASQALVVMPDPQNGNRDVWVVTLDTGALTRVTSHPGGDWFPVWSPDGSEVVFTSDRDQTQAFYRIRLSGGGGEQTVFTASTPGFIAPTDWSPDGQSLLMHTYPRGDISLLPLSPGATPRAITTSPFTEWVAAFSPDGQRVAYVSDESGVEEIYVRAIPSPERQRVSVDGGIQPRWRRDGSELFYIGAGDRLFAARVVQRPRFALHTPVALFDACSTTRGNNPFSYRYDVAPDGERSLWICDDTTRQAAIVMINAVTAR
jgi:Tol biopolymer transport system component